ncbi:MAG: RidA family protein [Pseudolysinimonas sp.]|uniref:RidA family protein n=1 Tax=Pseudolysinimonas sp. TaxID=2680009 RepID=UPI003263901D
MREVIHTPLVSQSALYSQGIKAGGHIYISGLVGIDASTGKIAGTTIQDQMQAALTNCKSVLEAGGGTLEDVVEVGILLADPDDFAGMNEVYATWFPTDPPARYAAKLGAVIPGVLVSVRMTAVIG